MQPWGKVLVPPQRIHTTMSLSFADSETPSRWEKFNNGMLPTGTQTPDQLELEGWWCWLLLTSPPTNQKNVPKLIMPLVNDYYKTSHYPLQVGTHGFEGISPLWPPLPSYSFLFHPKFCLRALIWCRGTEAGFGFNRFWSQMPSQATEPSCCTLCRCHIYIDWDFPGGPLGKTLSSQCRRPSFDPWSGN